LGLAPILLSQKQFVFSRFLWAALVSAIVAGTLLALLLSFGRRLFPVKVGPDGLVGYSFVKAGLAIDWQEITAIRPFSLGGLKYLRLYSKEKRNPIWIPLFLAREREFKQAVLDFSPSNHLIRGFV
jgi:hypothetical protein